MEIRTIITEALSRANIIPRRQQRQTASDDLVQSAYMLLQGIINSYNNDNYLAFSQRQVDLPYRSVIHLYDMDDTFGGENNRYFNTVEELNDPLNIPTADDVDNDVHAVVKSNPSIIYVATAQMPAPVWQPRDFDEFDPRDQQMKTYCEAVHINVKRVAKLNTLMVKVPTAGQEAIKLAFVPRSEFDRTYRADFAWTFVQLAEGEWVIETRSYAYANASKLRLDYNEAIRIDLDTDLRVPDAYIELLICALTYKLAIKYPRMTDEQVQRLSIELQTMIDNVSTPKADVKMIKRDNDTIYDNSYWGVISGRCFY